MKIKIISTVKNNSKYIEKFILSVINQRGYENFDLLIVDSDSKDGTIDILEKYSSYIEFISEEDSGQSEGFNKAIKMVDEEKYKYILIMDSDDELNKEALMSYKDSIINKEYDLVYGHTQIINGNNSKLKTVYSVKFDINRIKYGLAVPPSCGLLIKTSILKKNLFDLDLHYNMDTDLFLRLGNVKSKVINRRTVNFRMTENNKTGKTFYEGELNNRQQDERDLIKSRYNLNNIKKNKIIIYKTYIEKIARIILCRK